MDYQNEIYVKLETTSLKGADSVFVLTFKVDDNNPIQMLMKTDIQPSDDTLRYLNIARSVFNSLMSDAPDRKSVILNFIGQITQLPSKPLVYVWNDFTAKRFTELLKSQGINIYAYFKTTPISVSELHKFNHRFFEGVAPARFQDAVAMYGEDATSDHYLNIMQRVLKKIESKWATQ